MVVRAIRELPVDTLRFFRRTAALPFQTAIALVAIWSGVASMFDYSVSSITMDAILPDNLVLVFNIVYIVSGFALIAGLGWAYRNLEAFGLIALFVSLVVRGVTMFAMAGMTMIVTNGIVQTLTFGVACLVRLYTIIKKKDVTFVDRNVVTHPSEVGIHV